MNYFLSLLYSKFQDPNKLSRHDGPASVQKAYTNAELREMLRETGCGFELERVYLYRLAAIAWKERMQTG